MNLQKYSKKVSTGHSILNNTYKSHLTFWNPTTWYRTHSEQTWPTIFRPVSKNEGNAPTIFTSDHTETAGTWHRSSTGPGCVTTRHRHAVSQQAFATHLWLPVAIECLLKNTEHNKEQQWIHTLIHVPRVNFHVITSYCPISIQRVLSHLPWFEVREWNMLSAISRYDPNLVFLKELYVSYWDLLMK